MTDPVKKNIKPRDVIIRIKKSCELANEYGRKKIVPNKYFKRLSINSTEKEIQEFCNANFEREEIQEKACGLDKEFVCFISALSLKNILKD